MSSPFEVLGLSRKNTGLQELKRTYARLIKDHPPDRDPEGFRRVHEAYEQAREIIERRELAGVPDFRVVEDRPATQDRSPQTPRPRPQPQPQPQREHRRSAAPLIADRAPPPAKYATSDGFGAGRAIGGYVPRREPRARRTRPPAHSNRMSNWWWIPVAVLLLIQVCRHLPDSASSARGTPIPQFSPAERARSEALMKEYRAGRIDANELLRRTRNPSALPLEYGSDPQLLVIRNRMVSGGTRAEQELQRFIDGRAGIAKTDPRYRRMLRALSKDYSLPPNLRARAKRAYGQRYGTSSNPLPTPHWRRPGVSTTPTTPPPPGHYDPLKKLADEYRRKHPHSPHNPYDPTGSNKPKKKGKRSTFPGGVPDPTPKIPGVP